VKPSRAGCASGAGAAHSGERCALDRCAEVAARAAPRVGPGAFAVFAVVLAVIIASMFWFDTKAIELARREPLGCTTSPTRSPITGDRAFVYPFGIVLLALAAVLSPWLTKMSPGVLTALAVRFGFLFVAIGLPSLFATVIKRLIGRARPYVGGHDDPFAYMPFIWKPEYASMPSGHATTAAAAAIAIGAVWPRLRPLMWIYALVIMASRI
jgi:undecaprenyl-diphosphatase